MAERSSPVYIYIQEDKVFKKLITLKQYKIRKMASEFIYQNKGLGLQVGPSSQPACVSYARRVGWMSNHHLRVHVLEAWSSVTPCG